MEPLLQRAVEPQGHEPALAGDGLHPSHRWRCSAQCGPRPGNPTNTAEPAAKGREVSIRESERFAATVLPIIESIRGSGVTSLRGIAIALNNRGVRTARGGSWQVSNVRNLVRRETEGPVL